jgi:hypothetical protein
MEDQLSEELLDMSTEYTERVEDCKICNMRLNAYNIARAIYGETKIKMDIESALGDDVRYEDKIKADLFYTIAKNQYQEIIDHGHVDFPPAQDPPVGQ